MSPYQVLGISEEASFEEIQSARERLLASLGADEQQQERVEQAYDAILMQRLRLRKEGKIAVPDRIRYAEQRATPTPAPDLSVPPPAGKTSSWIHRWLDTPTLADTLLPTTAILGGLIAWVIFTSDEYPSLQLALGLMVSIYFLYRKERRFIRSFLLALAGLSLGLLLAYGIVIPLTGGDAPGALLVGITFGVMWLITNFLH
ncbi:MAG: CPP1-like family protein [Thermostichus sp. DG_1_5_bins_95]